MVSGAREGDARSVCQLTGSRIPVDLIAAHSLHFNLTISGVASSAPAGRRRCDIWPWPGRVLRAHHRSVRKISATAAAVIVAVVALVWARSALGAASGWFAFLVVWVPMVTVGSLSRVVQVRLPARYHELRRFERDGRLYELLGVRFAKLALRRGPLAVFNPQLHLPPDRTPAQLEHLAQRMRDAEASHAVLFVVMLPVVVHAAARGWWPAAALTLVFDVLMNLYPVMLQRYNRAGLAARFHLANA